VFVSAEVLQSATNSTTVTLRNGSRQVKDGPYAETKEPGGTFVVDVPDLGKALLHAGRSP
jgi:hypothetical protein